MDSLFFQNPLQKEELKRRRRVRDKDSRDLRGHYFRDATAIIHSYPFRRLKHKTQVFFAPKNDHICTRMEHVIHVSTVASTICRAFNLNPDLAWAIGVGHDLGHTPFGHLGEQILGDLAGVNFQHEIYSLRVVDHLTQYGQGMNLTYAVRDGIIHHCGEKFERELVPDFTIKDLSAIKDREGYPGTWEGIVVRMADKIAYLGRDLEDAQQLKMITRDEIPSEAGDILGVTNSEIINTLVNDLIRYSLDSGVVGFSEEVYQAFLVMKDFNYRRIYKSQALSRYHEYFERILTTLHLYLSDLFKQGGFTSPLYEEEHNRLATRFGDYLSKMAPFYQEIEKSPDQVVLDYLAGMTDVFAMDSVQEILIPGQFNLDFN